MSRKSKLHFVWFAASAGVVAAAVGCGGGGKEGAAPTSGTKTASSVQTGLTTMPAPKYDLAPATPVKTIGLNVFAKAELKEPRSIRVDPNGNLFLVDYVGAQVIVLSPAGTVSARWSLGKADAIGADAGPAGFYSLDSNTLKVQVFDPSGKAVRSIDMTKAAAYNPRGIAVAPDGTFYIADTGDNKVVHLSAGGDVVKIIEGDGSLKFKEPSDIAVAADGMVAIADGERQRVVLLSSKDEPLGSVPVPGGGGFDGIRLDEADGGFLAATLDSVFFIPKEGGQAKAVCGSAAGVPDQLHGRAFGVAWDGMQKVFYVSEPKGLQVFKLK